MYRFTPLVVVIAFCINLAGIIQGQAPPAKAGDEPKVQILVPTVELPPHYRFQDSKQFTLIEWPKSRLREDVSETITSYDQIKGRSSRHYKLKPNEPIYKNDLAEEEPLRNGEVAHVLTLSRSLSGLLQKGNRVDIMVTHPTNKLGNPVVTTEYVFEDIEVLGVNSERSKNAEGVEKVSYSVQLRLTPPQALMLKQTQDTAKVDVVRRKIGDPRARDGLAKSRETFNLGPDTTLLNAPATPEHKVLDRWLGNWQTTYKQLKPEEKTGSAETLTTRVIGGQFVQEATAHSDKTMSRSTITYDAEKKTYRSWWFSSTGQTDESTGTWDADQKTMTWYSTTIGDAKTTVKQHFKDDDTLEFDVVAKDRAGRVVFHMEGKSVRVKKAVK